MTDPILAHPNALNAMQLRDHEAEWRTLFGAEPPGRRRLAGRLAYRARSPNPRCAIGIAKGLPTIDNFSLQKMESIVVSSSLVQDATTQTNLSPPTFCFGALLHLKDQAAYQWYYEQGLCRSGVVTHDEIPVVFEKDNFWHAFFESSGPDRRKDVFSTERAKRMDWIGAALSYPRVRLRQGWVSNQGRHDPTRRVTSSKGGSHPSSGCVWDEMGSSKGLS